MCPVYRECHEMFQKKLHYIKGNILYAMVFDIAVTLKPDLERDITIFKYRDLSFITPIR